MLQIQGSGNVVSQERTISSFTRLHLSTHGEIEIIQSNEERVIVETDDNLQEFIEANSSGRTLYVVEDSGIKKPVFTSLKITVYVRQLDTLKNSSQANVYSSNKILSLFAFTLGIASHGDTKLDIEAPSIKANIACQGNVILSAKCKELNIKSAFAGSLTMPNVDAWSFNLKDASGGDITLAGTCNEFDFKGASSGNLYAQELKANVVVFHAASSGNAKLYANQHLTIRTASHGFIHYYGPGILKKLANYGDGEVVHKE